MNSNGKRLLDHCSSASRAYPGCVARINQYDHTTSIFSFVGGVLYQLIPGCIRDTFRQAMVLKHVLDVQLFKSQQTKAVHQITTAFVSKIPATVGDTLVDMSDCFASPGSFGGSLAVERLRCAFASFFSFPKREQFVGIVQRKRFLLFLPGIFTRGKGFVVNPATHFQCVDQLGALVFGGSQAVLEGFHSDSLLLLRFLYSTHVLVCQALRLIPPLQKQENWRCILVK